MMPEPKHSPPRWAYRFLEWYCAPDLLEEVAGDIDELFQRHAREKGLRAARRRFVWDVIRFCNYSTIRGRGTRPDHKPSWDMYRNYLKIAVRNLIHQKEYSLINIIGLALGLTCAILLSVYGQDELSFDAFHGKSDRIYRVLQEVEDPEQGLRRFSASPNPAGRALVADFPQFTHTVPLLQFGQAVMVVEDSLSGKSQHFNERDYLFTGADFFRVFDFDLIQGDPATVLSAPQQVVLTQRAAERYFGKDVDPIGRSLEFNRAGRLMVSGLLANPPQNSHIDFDLLISLESLLTDDQARAYFNDWSRSGIYHYVLAGEPLDPAEFQPQLDAFAEKYRPQESGPGRLRLQPMSEVHFGSEGIEYDLNSSARSRRSRVYLVVFGWVSMLVLLIAGINYVNLATASSLRRSREIGIRKVAGARRGQLIAQFLVESTLTALLALLIACALAYAFLGAFNEIAGKSLTINFLQQPWLLVWLLGITLGLGLLAGVFPAFFLSGFRIISVLKGMLRSGGGGTQLRRGLVVAQFVATLSILVTTVIVYQQLRYVQTKDLGFGKEHLVVIDINSGVARTDFEVFKSELGKHPGVLEVCTSSRVPGEWKDIVQVTVLPQQGGRIDSFQSLFFCFDEDALATFGMELIAGNNFSGNVAADAASILLNESAARLPGWDEPVGQYLSVSNVPHPLRVIGLVRDFHVRSLHEEIGPLMIGFRENPIQSIDYFTCRISGNDIAGTLAHIAQVQERLDPATPLEYHFLDQQLDRFYEEDTRVGKIFMISALLTLLIACMGLFGLVTHAIAQRTREVGIRKVLGANVGQLWYLLTREIFLLIGLALVIAVPISWGAAQSWLSGFAFAISIKGWVFVLAGLCVMLIALMSVSYHIAKIVRSNPVDSLRCE